ncbi:MAG: hypothetical protein IPK16_29485 [Anaerolineales bacterium]|nr:hypothetical protein [Anaerolineales bacterium]
MDPFAPTHLLAGTGSFGPTSNNVLRSTDDGLTWQSVQTNLGAGVTFSTVPNLAWALANNMALFVSNDGGATWANTGYGIQGDWWNSNYPIVTTEDALFAGGTAYGVWKSINDGANWAKHNNGIHSFRERSAEYCAQCDANRIYAGAVGVGLRLTVENLGAADRLWSIRIGCRPCDLLPTRLIRPSSMRALAAAIRAMSCAAKMRVSVSRRSMRIPS